MKSDAHIDIRDTRLGTGSQTEALCGKKITSVHLVRIWDGQAMGVAPDYPNKGICAECLKKSGKAKGSLVYVVREDKGEVVFSD